MDAEQFMMIMIIVYVWMLVEYAGGKNDGKYGTVKSIMIVQYFSVMIL
jgi:hypothetical protein